LVSSQPGQPGGVGCLEQLHYDGHLTRYDGAG
jgi:hypothetical protein